MPEPNQFLYKVNYDGKLETVRFLEESVVEGATVPTWLVRRTGRRIRCAVGSYSETQELAWSRYLVYLKGHLPELKTAMNDAEQRYTDCSAEIIRVSAVLQRLFDDTPAEIGENLA